MDFLKIPEGPAGEYAGTQAAMDVAISEAIAGGLIPVFGAPNTLLLDLDNGAEINQEAFTRLKEQFGVPTEESWTSQGGKGKHVLLTFPEAGFDFSMHNFSPAEALALEGALGSDPRRVIFGIARLKLGVEQPRMLFRPPTPEEQAQQDKDKAELFDFSAVDSI